ncbi:ATP-dependent helicase HrpB [Kineosporia sp. J2-2]|uniref:ATP-dependent helicase HrpB n=1 Tax=Kineosporia corallincola TaxID=2835133 RepID=A0ABS5TPN7_9ACTN|nr:ATP-dependent helicase C-terminal domain-containing protein [Kineosporia corallincola]MBT0772334.1 ATP-dependent helicase HrpB [Kineosporia corallincola]
MGVPLSGLLPTAAAALERSLPISDTIPVLLQRLTAAGSGVLVSPPGTGKTTLVPLALADAVASSGGTGAGRVLVAEPRRVAARAAARRMAWLLGEEVGGSVGYAVRGERRVGPRTRVEVVTTGLLVRRMLADAELPGTAAILLDECHERHLDTDLALAFATEARAALRPDLLLLAASATADSDRLAALLGDGATPAPVIGADAPLFPVEPFWCPPAGPVDPPHGLRVDPRLLDHVASVVRRALAEAPGDVLVFLPGAGEIEGVARRLGGAGGPDGPGARVLRLHGRMSGRDQDAALQGPGGPGGPGSPGGRRVVLATSVAESSLTVPGVRIVVDAGLARVPRTDLARGLSGLATVRVSRASAHQRAGRAGREAPGRVYRCWAQAEHDRLAAHPEPEVAVADLTGFALSLAVWGSPDPASLPLPSQPPAAAMTVARRTLETIGAVDDGGRVTAHGTRIASAGVHPRLARALIDGAGLVGDRRAAEIVALLADDSLAGGTDDLGAAWRRLRRGGDPLAARWKDEVRRLRSAVPVGVPVGAATPAGTGGGTSPGGAGSGSGGAGSGSGSGSGGAGSGSGGAGSVSGGAGSGGARSGGAGSPGTPAGLPDDLAAGLVTGLAFPERLARLRRTGGYLMSGGTGAELSGGSGLTGIGWLAVAVAQRQAGAQAARVRLAAAIDEATALEAGSGLLRTTDEVTWENGDVVARQRDLLGAIVLAERPLPRPAPHLVQAALREGLEKEGLGLLRWTPAATHLRARLALLHRAFRAPASPGQATEQVTQQATDPATGVTWPDVSDAALLSRAQEWLTTARRRSDLQRVDLVQVLRGLLDHRALRQLDELAPERIVVPSSSSLALTYSTDPLDPADPVLAVKLQEVFGWGTAPRIAGGRVPVVLHLLSPAGRPLAVTADLESFWRNAYPGVRSEMRGRYPKHPWPDDPTTAVATRRTRNAAHR